MIRPNENQLKAILRLANTDEFKLLISWIAESRVAEAIEAVDFDKEPKRSWMQGRVQQLSIMLNMIRNAEQLLDATLRQKKGA